MVLERSVALWCASDGGHVYGVWRHWKKPHVDAEEQAALPTSPLRRGIEAPHRLQQREDAHQAARGPGPGPTHHLPDPGG